MKFLKSPYGQLSLELLIFSTVTVILMGGFVLWAGSFLNLSVRDFNKNLAFSLAEGGIEYYRWHLAHASTDYTDGTGHAGPYIHNYYSKDGDLIGTFSLEITPPPAGSTIVTIRSTGQVAADSSVQKIIEVRLGIPSFAKYAWAEGSSDSFGTNAEVFGPIRVNGGVHFDGLAHNLVESSYVHYNHNNESPSGDEWGVHTNNGTDDPAWSSTGTLPLRPDVFMGGRQVGQPDLDFEGMAQDLADIKDAAVASGTYFASSGVRGYELVFATSGIFSIYKVNTTSTKGSCNYERWTPQTTTFYATGTIPNNGNLFFEDNLWVRGKINGKRVTVGAAQFPDSSSTRKSITVNNDLLYTQYSCTDAIALVAQNDVNIGYSSEDDLRIDGALVAENGSIGRNSYSSGSCGASSTRSQLTMYGTFVNKAIRGLSTYSNRTYIYDSNLLYCPPPSFPLTTDQYSLISWDEVK